MNTFSSRQRGAAMVTAALLGMGLYATSAQAATYTVTNLNDSGAGSLRQAILNANATPADADVITFDATVFSAPKTIVLSSSLDITGTGVLTINGPASLCTISGNNAVRVFNVVGAPVEFNDLSIANGRISASNQSGAGIDAHNARLTLNRCIVANNTNTPASFNLGGGISIRAQDGGIASLSLVNCTLSGNSAYYGGGGISANADAQNGNVIVSATGCTFAGNSGSIGGGLSLNLASAATLVNCTFSNNITAVPSGGGQGIGGAIYVRGAVSSSLNATNCTLANNAAEGSGGGLYAEGSCSLVNTIVANNIAPTGPNVFGSLTVNRNNLLVNDTRLATTLANNGGPTQTLALRSGSPAIDAGTSTGAPSTDQRGLPRPFGSAPDIGAFEAQNTAPVISSVSIDPSGPKTNDILTAKVTATDAENDTLTYSYQWKKNGQNIQGQTAANLDLSVAGNGDKGDQISVVVTASDGSASTSSESARVTIANSAPAITFFIRPLNPGTNDTLSLTVTSTGDADGDTLTRTYQWKKNGNILNGQTSDTLDLTQTGIRVKGTTYSLVVTVSDGTTSTSVESNSVAIVNSAPQISRVTITPAAPLTGDTLTANVVATDADSGDVPTYSYQWKKNDTVLAGETGKTLDLSKAGNGDDGDSITVTVVANDGTVNSFPLSSQPVVISNRAPVVESVTPQGATDKVSDKRTFSITVSDENGAGDIKDLWLLVNDRLNWGEGATLIYVPSAGSPTSGLLYLRRGDAFLSPIQVGAGASSSAALDNGAVRVVASDVTVTVAGNSLTLSIPATIRDGLVGQNTLFARVSDSAGATDPNALPGDTGYIRSGTYTVTPQFSGTNVPPVLSKLSPGTTYTTLSSSGVASGPQRFVFYVKDDNGIGDIESVWFFAGSQMSFGNSALIVYQPRTRRLFLRSDNDTQWLGGGQIGQPGIIENKQVRIDLSKISVNLYPDGKSFGITLLLEPKFGLMGNTNPNVYSDIPTQNTIWLRAQDRSGAVTANSETQGFAKGFVPSGTWYVNRQFPSYSSSAPSASAPSSGNS